jgi:protein kinase-like protein/type III secretion system (T3SS) inner membrane Yop/YscD-like protein
MALEYLRGKTLEAVLREGVALDWRQSLVTVSRLADALHHAHRNRIIHRDIKPANVMVLGSGEPKLMDFGVAKLEASQLTMGGQVFGSPSYMSPEQAAGERVDERTDIFSLGSVAYELLTGQRAFPGKDVASIVMRLASEDPPPPSRVLAGLPMAVDAVLARALAKSREKRYANAKALAEDLEDLLAGRAPRHAGPAGPATMVATGGRATPAAPMVGDSTILARAVSPALPTTTRVSLAVLDGPQRGTALAFERARISIGRSGGGADFELADGEVSRTHAVLECHGRRVVLRDLGSTNGTFVGERRVEEAELPNRSEFRVGRTRLMLILADED